MPAIDPPGIPEMKQVDLYQKYRGFVPDHFHHLICPKPSDEMIDRIKDHRRRTANKRLDKIKMMKGKKMIVDDEDDEELDDDKIKQCSVVEKGASVVDAPEKNENLIVESLLV